MKRCLGTLLAAFSLILGTGALTPAGAYDYGTWYTFTRHVNLQGQKLVADNFCIEWHIVGDMKFRVAHYGKTGTLYYKSPRLVDPKVTILAYDRCVSHYYDYRNNRRFYGADLAGRVYGNTSETCRWNPSVTAGWPWAISVSVTPECGSTKTRRGFQARIEPNSLVHSVYFQVNGTATRWDSSGSTRAVYDHGYVHNLCFAYRALFTIYRKAGSSAGGIGDKGAKVTSCVNIWEATPYA